VQAVVAEPSAADRALRRSAVYRFLSVALRPPDEGLAAVIADAGVHAALREASRAAGEGITAPIQAALSHFTGAAPGTLTDEFDRVFGHQVGHDCPPYEAQYTAGEIFQQTQCIADVAGFYRAFGLDVGDEAHERPDHLSLELEFMHALAYREAYARVHHGPADVELLTDAQRTFLRDHLARWVPTFSRLVTRKTDGPYGALAALLERWIAADAEGLGAGPVEEVDLTPSADTLDLEADAFACGAGRCSPEPPA